MEKNRLEAFSDGVIAIIITILVLEIKVPHIEGEINSAALLTSLLKILPKFLSWALSFYMVLIMWVNHHRIFNDIKQTDGGLLWVNGLLLFWMSFVPFPTAFMGDYFTYPAAMSFFGLCLTMLGFSFYILRSYLLRKKELLKEAVELENFKRLKMLSLVSPIMYFTGACASLINVYAAYLIYFTIPVYFMFFGSNKKLRKEN